MSYDSINLPLYHFRSNDRVFITDVEEISGRDKRRDSYGLGGYFSQRGGGHNSPVKKVRGDNIV